MHVRPANRPPRPRLASAFADCHGPARVATNGTTFRQGTGPLPLSCHAYRARVIRQHCTFTIGLIVTPEGAQAVGLPAADPDTHRELASSWPDELQVSCSAGSTDFQKGS